MQIWWNSTAWLKRYPAYKKWDVDANADGIHTETSISPLTSVMKEF